MTWHERICRRWGFGAYLSTQFLGAFNDNLSKLLVICFGTGVLGSSTPRGSAFMTLAAAGFILPYLLFSSLAGYLADRFSKRTVMIWTKFAEIIIMSAGFWLACRHALYGLLIVLFAMGSQSAFFSPAKYGFLPETRSGSLSRANGLTQLFTFLAIIIGGWAGGMISDFFGNQPAGGFAFCVLFAAAGTLTSLFITPTSPGNPRAVFRLEDPFTPHWHTLREMAHDRLLLTAILGNTYFWFLGTVFQLILVVLVQNTLHGSSAMVGNLQGAIALGIGLGCVCAGLLSRSHATCRFVVPAAAAMTVDALLLAALGRFAAPVFALTVILGICAGFYQLPLSTAIQQRAPAAERGRYIGASNALDCLSMLAGSAFLWYMQTILHFGARAIIAAVGLLTAIAALILHHCLRQSVPPSPPPTPGNTP